jgi:hypothetical protein
MNLEDVSNEALANIAEGYQKKRAAYGLPRADAQVVLDATTYCYLQLLKMQNAGYAFEAAVDGAADETSH